MKWSSLVRFLKLVHSPVASGPEIGSLRKRYRGERNDRHPLYMKLFFGLGKHVL